MKDHSEKLSLILQGAKFKIGNVGFEYKVFHDPFGSICSLYSDGRVLRNEGYVNAAKCKGYTLAVDITGLTKVATVYFDVSVDLDLL